MFDGNGNWTSEFSAQVDRDNGIKILASRFDNIFIADLKESFENCITKDGQIGFVGDINANGNKVFNVKDGTNTTDAVNKGQLDSNINTLLRNLYPVGSIYIGTQATCPLATLISGSQWQLVATSIITGVNSNVPVKGTGTSMGITGGGMTDGSGTSSGSWISGTGGSGDKRIAMAKNSYNLALNDTSYSTKEISGGRAIGLVTNANNSGIVGTVTSSSLAVNIWKRTA